MSILRRELAPVTPEAWKEIDAAAAGKLKLDLAGRKLVEVRGPYGWEYGAVNLGRLDLDAPGAKRRYQRLMRLPTRLLQPPRPRFGASRPRIPHVRYWEITSTLPLMRPIRPHQPHNFLFDELGRRLEQGMVAFRFDLQMAHEGYPIDAPSTFWPEDRERMTVGRQELTRPITLKEIGEPLMMHDPTKVTDGIEISPNDQIMWPRGGAPISSRRRSVAVVGTHVPSQNSTTTNEKHTAAGHALRCRPHVKPAPNCLGTHR